MRILAQVADKYDGFCFICSMIIGISHERIEASKGKDPNKPNKKK